jgi:hypothetical protein
MSTAGQGRAALDVHTLFLDGGKGEVIRTQPRRVSGMIVSLKEGQFNLWLGEYGAPPDTNVRIDRVVPHLYFSAIGYPVFLPLPCKEYVFTVTGPGYGTITLVG